MLQSLYKFGEFELDRASFELRRQGRAQKLDRIPLERIPMELLILLAERQGNVVTRQEIVDRLWGKDVFVDTEHGINTAIRKIRQALKDDPDHPRFVQTVTGKGYRFILEKPGNPEAPQSMEGPTPQKPALSEVEEPGGAELPKSPQSMEGRTPRPPSGAEVPRRSLTTPPEAEPPTPASSKKLKLAAALAFVLLATALIFLFRTRSFPSTYASQIHSLAVIPLANLSGDPTQDYFADGMTDELITALAKNRTLRVVSRTSAMQYKGVKRPLPEIARELGVDGILEGSIERTADRVHMTVQLIYAPTDSHVWAESYDRDLNQAYSLPGELSQTVAKEVKTATSPAPAPRYINPEAHDAYLQGRYFWFTTFDPKATLPYFQKAIQLQPDYAAAWSGLADTYALEGMLDHAPLEVSQKAHAAALKALELDPLLPEAHNSLAAWYLFYGWDPVKADAEVRRTLELNPNYGEANYVRHYVFLAMNRPDDALREEKRAVELDPFARTWGLGACYIHLRQFDAAIGELRLQAQAHPNDVSVLSYLSLAYWFRGMYKESQLELEKALQLQGRKDAAAAVHNAWEQGGEKAVAHWGVNDIKAQARQHYVAPLDIAFAVACTGDKDETLKYLEAAYREHSPNLMVIQHEPFVDFLHSDPRYQALVKKIGLQPAW